VQLLARNPPVAAPPRGRGQRRNLRTYLKSMSRPRADVEGIEPPQTSCSGYCAIDGPGENCV
jgi:hypothetical protein